MKKIEIKIGSKAGIRLFGYNANAIYPFSKWPQMQVYNDGDETYVNLNEKKIRRIDFSTSRDKENDKRKEVSDESNFNNNPDYSLWRCLYFDCKRRQPI